MSQVSIEIKDLHKQYNNIQAVKNINFKINKGSIVGLLGPNGCGKTTTIGMMLGLIKPTSGTVFINGQNIENENNRTKILEKVNFISPYVELPKKLTVEENLKVYGKLYGVKNLGAIRALLHASMVFASALSPFLIGLAIDYNFGYFSIALFCIVLIICSSFPPFIFRNK